MPGRNWSTSVNSHVCLHLHERLLLLIRNCMCNPRFVYRQYRVSLVEGCQMSHLGQNRVKQSYESKRWQSLVLQLRQRSSYLACAIARLIVMLPWVHFHSCQGFCTCVDMHTCDHTCLQTRTEAIRVSWIGKIPRLVSRSSSKH